MLIKQPVWIVIQGNLSKIIVTVQINCSVFVHFCPNLSSQMIFLSKLHIMYSIYVWSTVACLYYRHTFRMYDQTYPGVLILEVDLNISPSSWDHRQFLIWGMHISLQSLHTACKDLWFNSALSNCSHFKSIERFLRRLCPPNQIPQLHIFSLVYSEIMSGKRLLSCDYW